VPSNPFAVGINLATYSYFSLVLLIALFFKFSRPFSLRNADIIICQLPFLGFVALETWPAIGYSLLLIFAAATIVRAYFDPGLERRPALGTNATVGALTFLVCVAFSFHTLYGLQVHPNRADLTRANVPHKQPREPDSPIVAWPAIQRRLGRTIASWVGIGIAYAAHLVVTVGLASAGTRWFNDMTLGLAAAVSYMASTAVLWSAGDPAYSLPPALIMVALLCAPTPTLSAFLLGLTAGIADGFVLLIPFWAPVLMRQNVRGFAGGLICGLLLSWLVAWAIGAQWALDAARIQLVYWSSAAAAPHTGVWGTAPAALRFAVVVVTLGLVSGFALWPLHKNLMSVVAATTAVLAATQLWYPYYGGTYVTWYLPFLLLMIFRPTLVRVRL